MIERFIGVYVQGPDATEPTKIQSFRVESEAMILFNREQDRLRGRPGWRALLMQEEWDGDKLVSLKEVK